MKTRNLKTKTLSILLVMVMLLGMMPLSVAAAAETTTVTGEASVTMQKGVSFFGGYYELTPSDGVTFTNIEWSVSDNLPAGITLGVNRAGGDGSARAFLSGTPTAMTNGAVSVTINAEATDGTNTYTGSLDVSITVEDSPAHIRLDELIQNAACEVPMSTANTAEAVVAWVQNTWLPSLDGYSELISQLDYGWTITVEAVSVPEEDLGGFTAAVAGTESDPDGTDGSLTVRFRLDENYNYLDNGKECIIKATEYSEHTHSYTAVVTEPTCGEQGYTTYTCSCRDSYVNDYVDALGHDWGEWASIGNGRHTRVCRNDSNHNQTATCGGTATCHELAFCPDCKTTYGEYDQKNHSGGTEVRNAKDATETENGYTGDTYCLGCDTLLNEGSIIYATGSGDDDDDTHTHNYSYYKFDGTNHWKMCLCGQGQAGSVKPHSLVITGVSTGHFEECTVCDYNSDVEAHVYSDDSDAYCNECGYKRHVHDYSTAATCKSPAMCFCGATTGSKDPFNHTGGTEIRNAVEATRTEKGYTGDTYCKGCGSMIESGEELPAKGFVAVKIEDDADVLEVTFTTVEGVTLPDDAEVIVEDHTPSGDDLDFVALEEAPALNVVETLSDVAVLPHEFGDGTLYGPDGKEYTFYEKLIINGEEYYVNGAHADGRLLLFDKNGDAYWYDGNSLGQTDIVDKVIVPDNEYIRINGVVYQICFKSSVKYALWLDGKPVGQYDLMSKRFWYFNEEYTPDKVKEKQQYSNYLGTVTTGETPIDGLESGKTYNVSVIGANGISMKNATAVSGTITQTFDVPAEFVGNMYVTYVAYHGLVEGYELGKTFLSEDGKTVTATYTVDSFSPFIVYAFVEADEPEIKTLSATIVDDAAEQPANLTWLWITIAVVAVAGGGFAAYWFVIRKRRTANG